MVKMCFRIRQHEASRRRCRRRGRAMVAAMAAAFPAVEAAAARRK